MSNYEPARSHDRSVPVATLAVLLLAELRWITSPARAYGLCRLAPVLLLEVDRERDFNGARGQALFVVTGLGAQLAAHHRHAWTGAGRRFEPGGDLEGAAEHGNRLLGKWQALHLRFGIKHLLGIGSALGPGEADGDQVFVRRRIAADMEAGAQLGPKLLGERLAALYLCPLERGHAQYRVTLGGRAGRERRGQAQTDRRQ